MKTKGILISIFLFMVVFKMVAHYQNKAFKPTNDTALFWTESALQYRTAKLVALYGSIPLQDTKLQHPEGLNIRERLTVLMEIITGYAYRYFIPKSIPFHMFLLFFVAFFSSLSVIPLYCALSLQCGSKQAGLIGAAFYALTPAVYTTITAPGYEYQDFALPLIFFHIYFFVHAINKENSMTYAYAFLSAAFLFASLASWHVTQFYFALFVVFIIICFLVLQNFNIKPFYVITATAVLAGLAIPTQRCAGFLVSFSMLLSYGVIIASIIPWRFSAWRKIVSGFLILVAVLITLTTAFVRVPEYGLVYGLIWTQLRHLGVKPRDPSALPWETLVMWVSPFSGPNIKTIILSVGALTIAGITGIVFEIKNLLTKKISVVCGLLLFFSVVFFILYLFLIRLDAFLVWFFSFQAGMLFAVKRKIFKIAIIIFLCINTFLLLQMPKRSAGPDQNYLLGIIKYIRQQLPGQATILTSFAYGPTIVTYTDRAILLHPKFEAEHITQKIKSFEHRLFETEDAFYAFCQSYQAQYFVYQVDMLLALGTESMRYRTHNGAVSRDCAAYKFHFRPDQLKHFELVYSNPHYRIYHIVQKSETIKHITPDYYRIYDENMINISDLGIN